MENPRVYSEFDKVQKNRISSIIEEFCEDLMNIHGKCMDIGCGPGDITKDFLLPSLGSNAQIIGTDISESMIKYANKTFSDKKQLRFEILDIETKNLPKKYISEFDHIFSFQTLQWCKDIRQAFENIYQMLKPNATMLVYVIASHDLYEVLKFLEQDTRFAQYIPNSMKNISPYQESKNARKELRELLKNVGFTVHHCSLREVIYSDEKQMVQQFLNSLICLLTFIEDMPFDLIEEFKNILSYEYMRRKIYYKSIYNDQELVLDRCKALVVYAQKNI
ncbi:PREDICTED: juvenile hormone acid O-methyltransferase-like [Trachymyrmex cornetzi]|uniref:Putative methyltransferase 235L n=1 Tax=Trachymyrmex cornetzi TaxID=471704 RepID=A0A195EIY4_9HYME|nr:PREDICTED: juvenile hormone acid O-methyltransferase-like [Trachymyrmex cornetzi]KYN28220.1 Putative methyltransferase 235L [Trachymyrmex cornetzi]